MGGRTGGFLEVRFAHLGLGLGGGSSGVGSPDNEGGCIEEGKKAG